jgi:hypothetical protein
MLAEKYYFFFKVFILNYAQYNIKIDPKSYTLQRYQELRSQYQSLEIRLKSSGRCAPLKPGICGVSGIIRGSVG